LMLVPLLQLVGLDVQQGALDGIARALSSLYAAIARSRWLFFSQNRASDFIHLLTTEVERGDWPTLMANEASRLRALTSATRRSPVDIKSPAD